MSTYPNMREISMLETFGMEARALINQLEDQFPVMNPSPDDTIEKIMYRSGQRSVVEWIINNLETK